MCQDNERNWRAISKFYVDMNLTFKEHVKFVQKKKFGNIQPLRFFRQFVSQKRMLHLYKIYLQPVFQYRVLIYGSANKTDLLALEKIQILVWRILFGVKKFNSINNIRLIKDIKASFTINT